MEAATLMTQAMPLRIALAANSTATSFSSKIPTTTKPTCAPDSGYTAHNLGVDRVQNSCLAIFFGAGSENDTFSCRIVGWRKIGTGHAPGTLWVPIVLAEVACTISATVGIANAPVVATDRFVDTITLVTGNEDVSIDIVSPAADEIAHVVFDLKGCELLEFQFDMTGATNGNAIFALL